MSQFWGVAVMHCSFHRNIESGGVGGCRYHRAVYVIDIAVFGVSMIPHHLLLNRCSVYRFEFGQIVGAPPEK